jgi:uncharacterized protein (TIGR03089 family)
VTTLRDARDQALRLHAGTPLITDCTQGRVELSHATFDNWVSKTVNFLQMEAEVEPGATVALNLPLHWMTAVWFVAVWEAGADTSLTGAGADLVVGHEGPCDVLVVADPLGMAPAPTGMAAQWFFPADVRGMPDQRVLPPGVMGGMPDMSATQLYEAAREYATSIDLREGGRVNTSLAPDDLTGVLAAIAAPLAVDAAVVYAGGAAEGATACA